MLSAALALLLAAPARIVVMPIQAGEAISDKSAAALTDVLAAEVGRRAGAAVITSQDVASMLSLERQKRMLGCGTDSCMAELGGALGASRIVTGNVAKLGESLLMHLRVIDTTRAQVVGQSDRRFKRGGFDDLLDALPAMVAEALPGAAAAPPPSPPRAAAAAAAAPAPLVLKPGEIALHYTWNQGGYTAVRLIAWPSNEPPEALRVPDNRHLTAPGEPVPPTGVDDYGAYWILPAARFPNGRVNFQLQNGRWVMNRYSPCTGEAFGFWILTDSREAWLDDRGCVLRLDREEARKARR